MADAAPADPSTDRNLLFGAVALQADLIDEARFVEACVLWADQKATSLADLLVRRGWLSSEDRARVDYLVARKLGKHGGDIRSSLTEVITNRLRLSLGTVGDAGINRSLDLSTLAPDGDVAAPTASGRSNGAGRYSIVRLHATGGIGRVWLARDESLGRDVALKNLRPEWVDRPAVAARFLREARITGQLEHPSIVPIYEMGGGSAEQAPFYTMRFVHGRTLAEAVDEYHSRRKTVGDEPLRRRELLTAFGTVCNAVAYAHSRGVLHRDLKPQNVVLGNFGEVFVLDWGLARVTEEVEAENSGTPVDLGIDAAGRATVQGQVLGTPAYMAPEQAEGRLDRIGPVTDVYGLGAVLFEILTGQPPACAIETVAALQRLVRGDLPRPRSVVASVPLALEAICLKALATRPEDRYESARALADDLERFLADEPVAAYAEPMLTRAARWTRRHRTGVSTAALTALVVLLTLAVASVLLVAAYRESDRQRAAADVQRDIANRERDRARENFRLARAAVDDFDTRVSESPELKAHGLEALRGQLLESAVGFYQRLARGESTDSGVRAEQGYAYRRLAALAHALDHNDQARQAYEQSLSVFRELSDAHPEESVYAREVAEGHLRLGQLEHDAGHFAEAEAPYQRALALDQRLADAHPGVAEYQRALASAEHNLARLYRDTGRFGLAEPLYESALKVRRQLAGSHPGDEALQDELGWTLFNLGNQYGRTTRPEQSETMYREALAVWKPLADGRSAVPAYANQVAGALNNLGNLYADTGRLALAEEVHRQGLEVRQRLSDTHPAVSEYREDLAKSHTNLATIYQATGRLDAGERAYREGLAIRQRLVDEHPEVLDYAANHADTESLLGLLFHDRSQYPQALEWYGRALARLDAVLKKEPNHADAIEYRRASAARRAVTLSRLGRHTEARQALQQALGSDNISPEIRICRLLVRAGAGESDKVVAEADGLARNPELSGRDFYDLACVCAEANDPERAMVHLRKAQSLGYFGAAASVARLNANPAVAALRSRADYQSFVAELEKKAAQP